MLCWGIHWLSINKRWPIFSWRPERRTTICTHHYYIIPNSRGLLTNFSSALRAICNIGHLPGVGKLVRISESRLMQGGEVSPGCAPQVLPSAVALYETMVRVTIRIYAPGTAEAALAGGQPNNSNLGVNIQALDCSSAEQGPRFTLDALHAFLGPRLTRDLPHHYRMMFYEWDLSNNCICLPPPPSKSNQRAPCSTCQVMTTDIMALFPIGTTSAPIIVF